MEFTELANKYKDKVIGLAKELCVIPSPSGDEIKKVCFLKDLIEKTYEGSGIIDEEDNLTYLVKGKNSSKCILFSAHTDTVFPNDTPLQIRQEGNRLYCPSISDNTINCAGLFYGIGALYDSGITPEYDILFAFNSGEEGLGNLRGIRHLVKTYQDKLALVMALDLGYQKIITRAVGSKRYSITVKGKGGHSWSASHEVNSIAVLSQIISKIYEIPMGYSPKTTYNAGVISGGTSVNTVAAEANFLLDMRSDDREALQTLEKQVMEIVENSRKKVESIEISAVGDRPCGDGQISPIVRNAIDLINEKFDISPPEVAASTDANIPLSYGIPAFTTGVAIGDKVHSIGEYIEIDTVEKGLDIFFNYLMHFASLPIL